jgi:hypothetical protein
MPQEPQFIIHNKTHDTYISKENRFMFTPNKQEAYIYNNKKFAQVLCDEWEMEYTQFEFEVIDISK